MTGDGPLSPGPEEARLEQFKDDIRDGRYEIPAIEVANAIISFHREGRGHTGSAEGAEES